MAAIPPDPAQLAALIKSQNLATLLATMTGNGGLAAGKTVEAKLVALDADGNATALVNGIKVALVLAGPEARQVALQPGASLMLKLAAPAEPGAPLQATLVGIRPPPASNATPSAPAGQPTVGTTPPAPQSTPAAIPSTIPSATAQVATPAAALQAGRTTPTATVPVAPQTAPASPRAIAGPLLGAALGRQDSLAPLFANLGGLAQGSVALTLPKPLMALVDQILAQRLPTAETRPVTAETLKAAVARSGVFLEARQAAGEAPTPQTDLKAALQSLRDLLKPAVEGAPTARPPLPGETTTEATPQPGRSAIRSTPEQDAAASTPAKARPAPPRDGLLTPQPAAEPSLNSAARPATIAQALFGQAEAALDRIALAQYASLPQEAARLDQQPPARWLTEIPLALPNGTAVLPLEIERDPPQSGSATPDAPLWRVRFALDVEPLGALQGVVTLQGRAIGVSFWAEREETSRLLRQATPDLETSLLRSRFDSAEFEVFTGHPQQAKASAGQFLDRRS
ncbi:flagellar hook-length control protein FliK [Bosea vestrisii]|uniref:flagellar hook-length control protein FliK n=1 Tax=Bosea vestrisii TaxID=151416 RepID=UPI0024DFAA7A|nr:flagellar hook-length control protein FliK [Bosea vestrisii]WID97835.1 flagellar hook-length control protein FliK [Bosea vestrisii]